MSTADVTRHMIVLYVERRFKKEVAWVAPVVTDEVKVQFIDGSRATIKVGEVTL